VKVVSCSYISGMLFFLLCWVAYYVCVVQANIVYFMGGQLVFDWDRLENFLITRDRPVVDVVTNTKCQSWVSHVQMQCTTALVKLDSHDMRPLRFLSARVWFRDVKFFSDASGMVCVRVRDRFYGGTGGNVPQNFWTRGYIKYFVPPNILWWKVI